MEGNGKTRPAKMFAMVVLDVVLLLIFMAALWPSHVKILAATYLPVALIADVVFLRRSRERRIVRAAKASRSSAVRTDASSLYVCSGIFFMGSLYGLLTIIEGEFPRTLLPLLLIPLSVAVYCWKIARRMAARAPVEDNGDSNHSAGLVG